MEICQETLREPLFYDKKRHLFYYSYATEEVLIMLYGYEEVKRIKDDLFKRGLTCEIDWSEDE